MFANCFASTDSLYSQEFTRYKATQERNDIPLSTHHDLSYNQEISEHEFQHSLKKTRESAPGPDNITYSMIKAAHPTLLKYLLKLYNRIFLEEEELKSIPMRRWGKPTDIAGVAIMLASQAGAFITGQIIPVDGGTTLIN